MDIRAPGACLLRSKKCQEGRGASEEVLHLGCPCCKKATAVEKKSGCLSREKLGSSAKSEEITESGMGKLVGTMIEVEMVIE